MTTLSEAIRELRRAARPQGFVPIPLCAKVGVTAQVGTKSIVNTFHVTIPATAATSDIQAAADAIATAWQANLLNALGSTYIMGPTTVLSLEAADGPFATSTIGVGSPGTLGGTSLPLSICAVASLRTNLSGRRHRGRMYLSPVTESYLQAGSNGLLTADLVAAVISRVQGFSTALNTAGNPLLVASRQTSPGTATPVTAVVCHTHAGSQRRRIAV